MDELVHSDQKEYGENLASGSVDDNYENIVRNAVKLWYSEKNSGINGKGSFIFNFLDCERKNKKFMSSVIPNYFIALPSRLLPNTFYFFHYPTETTNKLFSKDNLTLLR